MEACLTEYEPYPSSGTQSTVVTDCSYTFNQTSGERINNQPSRVIIDDSYKKDVDGMENGVTKYF